MQHIILIHGIRTHAGWQEMVQRELEANPEVRVISLKYGYFDVLSFLLPGPTRRRPVEQTRRRLLWAMDKASQTGAEVSVIAHSFGSYTIARILQENRATRLKNLVLCGSIIRSDYDWEATSHQISGAVVNEVGARDIWPAIASAVTWGYGNCGTYGFGHSEVIDRKSAESHSSFFTPEFVRKRWKPLFDHGSVALPEEDVDISTAVPVLFGLFNLPWRYVWLLILTFGFFLMASAAPWQIFPEDSPSATDAEIRAWKAAKTGDDCGAFEEIYGAGGPFADQAKTRLDLAQFNPSNEELLLPVAIPAAETPSATETAAKIEALRRGEIMAARMCADSAQNFIGEAAPGKFVADGDPSCYPADGGFLCSLGGRAKCNFVVAGRERRCPSEEAKRQEAGQ